MNPESPHPDHHMPMAKAGIRAARPANWPCGCCFKLTSAGNPSRKFWTRLWRSRNSKGRTGLYAEELVRGTLEHLTELDGRLSALTTEWASDRQAAVDRNLLRLAAFELAVPTGRPRRRCGQRGGGTGEKIQHRRVRPLRQWRTRRVGSSAARRSLNSCSRERRRRRCRHLSCVPFALSEAEWVAGWAATPEDLRGVAAI